MEYHQGKACTEEYAKEVPQLVTQANPDMSLSTQEELAAEAFLRGYSNSKVANEALNQNLHILAEAQDIVEVFEHNFKATVGRDIAKVRSMKWEDLSCEIETEQNKGGSPAYVLLSIPKYIIEEALDKKLQDEMHSPRLLANWAQPKGLVPRIRCPLGSPTQRLASSQEAPSQLGPSTSVVHWALQM